MDLRTIFERKPQVCLVDGLAHDNPRAAGIRDAIRTSSS
jgi:K+-sensing histidine kinase KdpD